MDIYECITNFEKFGLNYLFTSNGKQTIQVIQQTQVYHRKEYLKAYAIKLINIWYHNKDPYQYNNILTKLLATLKKLSDHNYLLP